MQKLYNGLHVFMYETAHIDTHLSSRLTSLQQKMKYPLTTLFPLSTIWIFSMGQIICDVLSLSPLHSPIQSPTTSIPMSPFIRITFTVKGTTFSNVAILESGCSTSIMSIFSLPKYTRKQMSHSDVHVKGINNSINFLGELNCDIAIMINPFSCVGDSLHCSNSDQSKHPQPQHTQLIFNQQP